MSSIIIPMNTKVYLGMVVSAHNTSALNASTFSQPAAVPWETYSGYRNFYFNAAQLANPAISGAMADANSDGMSNLQAYAFGLDPWTPPTAANGGQPVVRFQNGHLTITFVELRFATDLTYVVEVSSDLVHWTAGSPYTTVTSATPLDSVREQVVVTDNSASPPAYIRVRVTTSP